MALHNPPGYETLATYRERRTQTVDNSGITHLIIKAPAGFRVSVVNVTEGIVEFERMAVAAGADKPKRKSGR